MEEPTTARKKLSIKTKDGKDVDLDQLKKEKTLETPVETPAETVVETPLVEPSTTESVATTAQTTDVIDMPALVDVKDQGESSAAETVVEEAEVNNTSSAANVEQSSTTTRRLVPGGKAKLNQGTVVKRYTKAEIMDLKPAEDTVPKLHLLGPIVAQGESSAPSTPHGKSGGGSGWQKQHQSVPRNRDGAPPAQGGQGQQPDNGWQRDAPLPNRKNKNAPAAPVPKKVITDPIEVLSSEVLTMLNKITPQTFEKLSKKFLELNIVNTAMLDKLVELIFEKAIGEPAFNAMYAELCLLLKEQATTWMFFNVVKNVESNDFFWIRDVVLPEDVAGPFFSRNECIAAVTAEEQPVLKPSTATLNAVEYILAKNLVIKVKFILFAFITIV